MKKVIKTLWTLVLALGAVRIGMYFVNESSVLFANTWIDSLFFKVGFVLWMYAIWCVCEYVLCKVVPEEKEVFIELRLAVKYGMYFSAQIIKFIVKRIAKLRVDNIRIMSWNKYYNKSVAQI